MSISASALRAELCFERYFAVAVALIEGGYYEWLLKAIEDCFHFNQTFIVFDCPSGTGKTQAGVALLVMAQTEAKIFDRQLKTAHIVWTSSVSSQAIYQAIQEEQEKNDIYVQDFFSIAKRWLQMPGRSSARKEGALEYKKHVWDHLLKFVFRKPSMMQVFMDGTTIIVLVWDEIPVEPTELALIGELRDELKTIDEIIIILSGTNSMAANMVGISTTRASFSDEKNEGDPWSLVVTRMPKFVPAASPHFSFWSDIQSSTDCEVKSVVDAISHSVQGNGNPRLINFAIAYLESVLRKATPEQAFTFEAWQKVFSDSNLRGKFLVTKWSEGSEILTSQANLLLAASSSSHLADKIIHRHYGQRSFPDRGTKACCSLLPNEKTNFGGWLKLCPSEWRCFGKNLYSGDVDHTSITGAHVDWQTSVFQPVQTDILLYLGCCWSQGYFLVGRIHSDDKLLKECSFNKFKALQLVRAYWNPNALGGFNFQNPQAPISTVAMMEVSLVLSVMNAAALSRGGSSDFFTFFERFLSELEIEMSAIPEKMLNDKAFQGIRIPRYVFPGPKDSSRLFKKNIGILERAANAESIDATLHGVECTNHFGKELREMYFEAKQRKSLDATELMKVTKKILKNDTSIGIMITSSSSKFEMEGEKPSEALANLNEWLEGEIDPTKKKGKWALIPSKLGTGYFVRVDNHGKGIITPFTFNEGKQGRFILIKLPDLSY